MSLLKSIFYFKKHCSQVQKGDFPHLLIYGPPGAGKKTRIMCIIKELYGSGAERVRMESMQFEVMILSLFIVIKIHGLHSGIHLRN